MASRRNISSKNGPITNGDHVAVLRPGGNPKSNIAPAVPAAVIYKLLGFTAAMIVAPLGTYYTTIDSIFHGNSTFAGAMAAVMANVVLVAYVIVAMKEDQSDRLEAEEKAKKGQ